MMRDNTGLLPIVNAIIWLRKRKLGLSFLLALVSWLVLSLLWGLTDVGSTSFNLIAALKVPGYDAGWYLAGILFGNARHPLAAPLLGLGCLIVMYTAFWYAVISAVSGMRSKDVPDGSEESRADPEEQ